MFTRKEEIFDNLCEKDVPASRAAWYIKVNYLCLSHYVIPPTRFGGWGGGGGGGGGGLTTSRATNIC